MTSRSAKAAAESLPHDQIARALGQVSLPGELPEFIEALSCLQQNVLRCRCDIDSEALPMATSAVPWYPLARRPLDRSVKPSRWLAYAAADYYVQDAGSLLALAAAGADTSLLDGLLVCDLCAAPGGKASALVEAIDNAGAWEDDATKARRGFVLANEAIRSRIGALQLNLARTGSDRYAVSNLDPESLADRLPGVFDVVVVDAPCSGQALLARGKQKISSLSTTQIGHSASRQRRILDAALRLLRDGGKLVYSTCTFAEQENEAQVRRLVNADVAQSQRVDKLAPYESLLSDNPTGCYRLWPHLHSCAGSFAASMVVRRDSSERHRCQGNRATKTPIDLAQWYDCAGESTRPAMRDSVIFGWPSDAPDWIDEITVGGPELAHRTGKTWKPSHAGALRRAGASRCAQVVDIDDEVAKVYLRGEPIPCGDVGWRVVRLRGRPLGWVKGNGSIGKNHLPAAARMLGELSS